METMTLDSQSVDRSTSSSAPQTPSARGEISPAALLEHWQGVYLLCLRITNDTHAAEDVVQEAYVRALSVLGKERPENPRTWLYCIAANLARNWLRDRSTHRRLEQTMAAQTHSQSQSSESAQSEAAPALRKHFRGLEEKYRVALSLHYEQGLSYREVAAVLEKPEGTTASLITRGITLLRESLALDGYSVAPAIVALELQKYGASALARPELLAALKSAVAAATAKSAAAATTAAAAKGGATVLTAKTVWVAGGLLLAASALIAGNQIFKRTAKPVVTLAPAPAIPAAPAPPPPAPAGDPAPAAAARKVHYFDSPFSFSVEVQVNGKKETYTTPSNNEFGIAVPENGEWVVTPVKVKPADVLSELRLRNVPGLNLEESTAPLPPGFFAELAKLPDLKTLIVEKITAEELAALKHSQSLERLSISDPKITDAMWADIAALTHLRRLKTQCPLSDAGAAQLLKLKKLESLTVRPTVKGFELLSALPELTELDVRMSDVIDVDVIASPAPLPKKLKELSLGKSTDKLRELQDLRAAAPEARVNGWTAVNDLDPVRPPKTAEEQINEALVALENSQHDANAVLLPPDAELIRVLENRKFTATFQDTPVDQALAEISAHCGIPIALDPAVFASAPPASINIRFTDMNCALALDWIMRLSSLQEVKTAHVVLITSLKRASVANKPLVRTFDLPAPPGEAAWTDEETQALARVVTNFATQGRRETSFDYDNFYIFSRDAGDRVCVPSGPGKVTVTGETAEKFDRFLNDFAEIPPRVIVPKWIKRFEDSTLILTEPATPQKRTLLWAVEALRSSGGSGNAGAGPGAAVVSGVGAVVLSPEIAPMRPVLIPATWPSKGANMTTALRELCDYAKLVAEYNSAGITLSKGPQQTDLIYTLILDLRPALAAGVKRGELATALQVITRQSGALPPEIVRGRWLTQCDPWTARRAMAVIDEAAKTGKIPAAGAVPWFFDTLRNATAESPKPPVNDEYDGEPSNEKKQAPQQGEF